MDSEERSSTTPQAVRILQVVTGAIALLTLVGLIIFWPSGEAKELGPTVADLEHFTADVTDVESIICTDALEQLPTDCQRVTVDITSGSLAGDNGHFLKSMIDRQTPEFAVGDSVILIHNPIAPEDYQLIFFDFQRSMPLLWLVILFAVVVIGFGRWKGLRALLGLTVSGVVIVGFLLPALLRDHHTIGVALVATAVIAFSALYLTHGITLSTTVALLGTLSSVALIAVIAVTFTAFMTITGLTEESVQVLTVTTDTIDPRGILIAGMVIGALGVLDDVTITQVSAVAELKKANPGFKPRELYRSAIEIGRAHVASTVNTLVLAYVGASLALVLFFHQEGRSIGQVLSREVVAVEILRMLAGSIGIVAAVPLTTWLAALVAQTGQLQAHHHHGGIDDHIGASAVHEGSSDSQALGGRSTDDSDAATWDDFGPEHHDDPKW